MNRAIAVDFDGTLCIENYPNTGEVLKEHKRIHDIVRREHDAGSIIILWTCRTGEPLQTAVDFCRLWNIPIDYVNENDPERVKHYGVDCRKISADIYLDDRAVNPLFKLEV